MRTRDDIESYLIRSGVAHTEPEEGTFVLLDDASRETIVIRIAGELVLFRVKVVELDKVRRREEFFARLLELNASDLVHGAYGIAGDAVVLVSVLRLENLDYNEFQGTIDDFSLALTNHYELLASFRDAA